MHKFAVILDELIEALKEGEKGYREAASEIECGNLRVLFREYSCQRRKFVEELHELSRVLGGNGSQGNVFSGDFHQPGWLNLKAALSTKNEHAVLFECERAEWTTLTKYKSALRAIDLPSDAFERLQSQFVKISESHQQVRELRDSVSGYSNLSQWDGTVTSVWGAESHLAVTIQNSPQVNAGF